MIERQPYSDRRRAAHRRAEERRASVYQTRREWLIAEFIIGVVSCAVGLTGISGGLVADTLALTANNMPWFILFFGSGSAFIVASFAENRCRYHLCSRDVLLRYAYVRFAAHVVNFFCWAMAFLWLYYSELTIASVYYEAIPLAVANFWAMAEHAKALWLNPCTARTTSLFGAGFRYLKGN